MQIAPWYCNPFLLLLTILIKSDMGNIMIETDNGIITTTVETLEQELANVGIRVRRTYTGYWQATCNDELLWDDSSCEDAYNKEMAIIMVYRIYQQQKK